MSQETAPNSSTHIEPWQGRHYHNGFRHGLRLLILGDSYHSDTWEPVVEQHIKTGSLKFYTKIQHMVTGDRSPDEPERRAFWEAVAFTNLIQEPMIAASAAPTFEQWVTAWSLFPEIIRLTKPNLIFCFSRRGWNIQEKLDTPFGGRCLKDLRPTHRPSDCAYLYDFAVMEAGYQAVAACFNHPNRNVQLDEWHDWAVTLINTAPAILGR